MDKVTLAAGDFATFKKEKMISKNFYAPGLYFTPTSDSGPWSH
jgi:hypothetical protein